MKKTLPALILLSLLAALFLPMVAAADVVPTECTMGRSGIQLPGGLSCPEKGAKANIETQGVCCLLNTIYNVTDWIFVALIALATVFVIIGAFLLLTSTGSTEKIATGRNYIIYAAIGLAVAFLAKAVPGIVRLIVGTT